VAVRDEDRKGLNRFGNVFGYREANRIGRETVAAAINVALGCFEVIYPDTDSVFE
jgi:hypothetical protein